MELNAKVLPMQCMHVPYKNKNKNKTKTKTKTTTKKNNALHSSLALLEGCLLGVWGVGRLYVLGM